MEEHMYTTSGRISRTTFWLRVVVASLCLYLVLVIDFIVEGWVIFIFSLVLIAAILVFLFIQGVKRVHDLDLPGWYALLPFYNIYLFLQEGERGRNNYGVNPMNQVLSNKSGKGREIKIVSKTNKMNNNRKGTDSKKIIIRKK